MASINVLSDASREWATRPDDERYLDLPSMLQAADRFAATSVGKVVSTRAFEVRPVAEAPEGLALVGKSGVPFLPTHWAFNQIAQRASIPADVIRDLGNVPLACDLLNWKLQHRPIEEVGILLQKEKEDPFGRAYAMTGPNYGRIRNRDVIHALSRVVGDGRTGHWRVPGEFGEKVEITKANTTLYMSHQDMFIFLADEDRRIEIPGRRAGKFGSFARGFFLRNSEVGAATFDLTGFFYDYTCSNRNVWGVEGIKRIKIRHTSGAPDRWLYEILPQLKAYSESSTKSLEAAIKERQQFKLGDKEKVDQFMLRRFTKSQVSAIHLAHMEAEQRPIETAWDVAVGATEYAKTIPWQDQRVRVETLAGDLMAAA